MLEKVDAFQMRGLRCISKTEHSCYSRVSNQEVYDKVDIILNKGTDLNIRWQEFITSNRFDKPREIAKLSSYIMKRRDKLLGNVIRAASADAMRQLTITDDLKNLGVSIRRAGRPRMSETSEKCKSVYKKQFNEEGNTDDADHIQWLKNEAYSRKF